MDRNLLALQLSKPITLRPVILLSSSVFQNPIDNSSEKSEWSLGVVRELH